MSERPGVGVLHQIFSREVRHEIKNKRSQSDLKFCKNEGLIRSKTNEKRGQLDRKLRRKLIHIGSTKG